MANTYPIALLQPPPPDWPAYYRALAEADAWWAEWTEDGPRAQGVFNGDDTYLATIDAGRRAVRGNWSNLTREDAQLVLGLMGDDGADHGLLGSMQGAGRAKHFFLAGTPQQLAEIGEILVPIFTAPPNDMARAAQEAVEGITRFNGISMGVASRILALARPDSLVSVNGNSKRNLALLAGKQATRLQSPAGYGELIDWTMQQPWWNSRQPTDPQERAAWNARAALLDCFAYEEL